MTELHRNFTYMNNNNFLTLLPSFIIVDKKINLFCAIISVALAKHYAQVLTSSERQSDLGVNF